MDNRKTVARMERIQQRVDAGLVATHFPEVTSIGISMIYNQRGLQKSLPRIVNFFPGSYALFRVDCLNKDCVDGGFDLTQIITAMIRNRRTQRENSGEGDGASNTTQLLSTKLHNIHRSALLSSAPSLIAISRVKRGSCPSLTAPVRRRTV
jgi:hypothetical protein